MDVVGELKTGVELVGTVAVCTLAGDLVLDTEEQVRAALDEGLALAPRVLAVDLAGAEMFTSSGLNVLLLTRLATQECGVPVVLIAPSGVVRRVLQVTEAAGLFPVCTGVEEAGRHAPPHGPDA